MREIPKLTLDNIQGSLEWHRQRLGCFTGSEIVNLTVNGKRKDTLFGNTATTYITNVMSQRFIHPDVIADDEMFAEYINQISPSSKAIEWGKMQELAAKSLYEQMTGDVVEDVPFILHPTIPHYGASPDGLVREKEKIIEVKCPAPRTAFAYMAGITDNETLLSIEDKYYWQIQAELDVTDAAYCDFVVYCPFLKTPIKVVKIYPSLDDINALHYRIEQAEVYGKARYNGMI